MKLREHLQQILIGGVICFGIHLKWGYTTPIVMQVLMTPLNMLDSALAKIYIFGKAAKGDLLRPWPAPNPLGFPMTTSGKTAKELKHESKKEAKKEVAKKDGKKSK